MKTKKHNYSHNMKLVSDLRQVGGFLRFPPPIKLTATILCRSYYVATAFVLRVSSFHYVHTKFLRRLW